MSLRGMFFADFFRALEQSSAAMDVVGIDTWVLACAGTRLHVAT